MTKSTLKDNRIMKREGGHFNNRSDTALYRYNYSFLGGAYSYT